MSATTSGVRWSSRPLTRSLIGCGTFGVRLIKHSGGNPFYARHLRGLMQRAGFTRVEALAVASEHYRTPAETRRQAQFIESLLSIPAVREIILSEGWADEAEMEQIRLGYRAWGERPDAFIAWMYCAAIGWVSEGNPIERRECGKGGGVRPS